MIISFPFGGDKKTTERRDDIPPYEKLISAVNVAKNTYFISVVMQESVFSPADTVDVVYCLPSPDSGARIFIK